MCWLVTCCSRWRHRPDVPEPVPPELQHGRGRGVLRGHRGSRFASSAADGPDDGGVHRGRSALRRAGGVDRCGLRQGAAQGRRHARALARSAAAGRDAASIGVAQEKIRTFRTEKRRNPVTGARLPVDRSGQPGRQPVLLLWAGPGLRPVLLEVLGLLPVQREAVLQRPPTTRSGRRQGRDRVHRAGQRVRRRARTPSGAARSATASDAARSTRSSAAGWPGCRTRSPALTAAAGYRYELSILQAEFSLTQVLDRPHQADLLRVADPRQPRPRPARQVSLIFDRRRAPAGQRPTPGRWRTRVLTDGVTPSLHVDYKHSKIKQYHKQDKALRTETTINDTRDFGIGKRLGNLPALRQVGFQPTGDCSPPNDSATTRSPDRRRAASGSASPSPPPGTRVPGLRLGVPARMLCWPRCACSGFFPAASPTATCGPSGPSSACPPSP